MSPTSFQQCIGDKLRGHEHQGRAAAKAAFIKAAHQCASEARHAGPESSPATMMNPPDDFKNRITLERELKRASDLVNEIDETLKENEYEE